jgi:hypothetical protein
MSTSHEGQPQRSAPQQQSDQSAAESLTDLIDRMDREAFRRSLANRELKMLSSRLHPPG